MSSYIPPVWHKNYALYFEEYKDVKDVPDLSYHLEQLVLLRQTNP